jgi:hypothetical protein
VQWDFDLAAGGKTVKESVDLLVAMAVEAEVYRVAGLKAVTDHVGSHEEGGAVFGQGAMQDEGTFFRGHFGSHGRFADLLELEVAFEALLVEGERFAALPIEIQVGI